MAQKQLTWTELRVGVFVLAGLFIIAVGILYVTGAGVLGPKYRLTTYLPEVEGVQTGAPVRVDGFEVGSVESIRLNPQPADKMHNIEVVMRINKKFRQNIRSDSTARLITEGLLGNRYVSITRGLEGEPVADNGIVPGKEEKAMKEIVERGADLMENLSALSSQVGGIVSKLQQGQGTLGKLLTDQDLYNHLHETVAAAETIATETRDGHGTLGQLVANDELYRKTNAAVGHLEDITAAVREQQGTLGKLVYDPAVYQNAKDFLGRGNAILDDVQAGKGTLGKLAKDDTLYSNMRDASANLRDATAKLNAGPGTMSKFFNDPQFYDNMTGLSGDLRLLIGEFRQNPKKFLHVKFSIF
jgi:phospholipid/cholesterol/gamma-HCH transport system substrate-binding protein